MNPYRVIKWNCVLRFLCDRLKKAINHIAKSISEALNSHILIFQCIKRGYVHATVNPGIRIFGHLSISVWICLTVPFTIDPAWISIYHINDRINEKRPSSIPFRALNKDHRSGYTLADYLLPNAKRSIGNLRFSLIIISYIQNSDISHCELLISFHHYF